MPYKFKQKEELASDELSTLGAYLMEMELIVGAGVMSAHFTMLRDNKIVAFILDHEDRYGFESSYGIQFIVDDSGNVSLLDEESTDFASFVIPESLKQRIIDTLRNMLEYQHGGRRRKSRHYRRRSGAVRRSTRRSRRH